MPTHPCYSDSNRYNSPPNSPSAKPFSAQLLETQPFLLPKPNPSGHPLFHFLHPHVLIHQRFLSALPPKYIQNAASSYHFQQDLIPQTSILTLIILLFSLPVCPHHSSLSVPTKTHIQSSRSCVPQPLRHPPPLTSGSSASAGGDTLHRTHPGLIAPAPFCHKGYRNAICSWPDE